MRYEMPRYYRNGQWFQVRRKSIPITDIESPCAICGWSKHMGIHGVPEGTTVPIGPIGLHSYVPKASAPQAQGEK